MKLFVDIDGVVRNMSQSVVEERTGIKNHMPENWFWKLNDKDIYDLVAEDYTVLSRCETTEYYEVIYKFACNNPITFLSCQPDLWVPHTNIWMKKYFGSAESDIRYFASSKDKLIYFKDAIKAGVNGYLIEDYPFTGLRKYIMKRIILIHYPYNKETGGIGYRVRTPKQLDNILEKL
jgi:hypothetical protein